MSSCWDKVIKFKVNTLHPMMKKKGLDIAKLIELDKKLFINNNKPSIWYLLGVIGRELYNKTLEHFEAKRMMNDVLDYLIKEGGNIE